MKKKEHLKSISTEGRMVSTTTKKRLSYLILLQIQTNSMFCVVNTQKEANRMPKATAFTIKTIVTSCITVRLNVFSYRKK